MHYSNHPTAERGPKVMTRTEPTPQHFARRAPERLIGLEAEYAVLVNEEREPERLVDGKYVKLAKLDQQLGTHPRPEKVTWQVWLGKGGGNIHTDVGYLEHCTPEMLGPRRATAADYGGMAVVSRLCGAYAQENPDKKIRAFRRAGDTVGGKTETNGFHPNLLMPRWVLDERAQLLVEKLSTHLATRSWAWSGTVGRDGIELSQKTAGIGAMVTTQSDTPPRTTRGGKSMGWIKTTANDSDVLSGEDWCRVEIRYDETGFSRAARFLGIGALSLMLRLIEHEEKLKGKIQDVALTDNILLRPVAAAHTVSRDLTLRQPLKTHNGKTMTAIDIQEHDALMVLELSKEVELPGDELLACRMWLDICDRMRKADPSKRELDSIIDFVDFAPKILYVSKNHARSTKSDPVYFQSEEIQSNNIEVLFRNLIWDQFYPEGPGLTFWKRLYERHRQAGDTAFDPIGDAFITRTLNSAPVGTRGGLRGRAIADPTQLGTITSVSWNEISIDDQDLPLRPYQTKLDNPSTT